MMKKSLLILSGLILLCFVFIASGDEIQPPSLSLEIGSPCNLVMSSEEADRYIVTSENGTILQNSTSDTFSFYEPQNFSFYSYNSTTVNLSDANNWTHWYYLLEHGWHIDTLIDEDFSDSIPSHWSNEYLLREKDWKRYVRGDEPGASLYHTNPVITRLKTNEVFNLTRYGSVNIGFDYYSDGHSVSGGEIIGNDITIENDGFKLYKHEDMEIGYYHTDIDLEPDIYNISFKGFITGPNEFRLWIDDISLSASIFKDYAPSSPEIHISDIIDDEVVISVESNDVEDDWIKYKVFWGDGDYDVSDYSPSDIGAVFNHVYSEAGNYKIVAVAIDSSDTSDVVSNEWVNNDGYQDYLQDMSLLKTKEIKIGGNYQPSVPTKIDGPSFLITGELGDFSTYINEIENDSVRGVFDFGNGDVRYTNFNSSGTFSYSYLWDEPGNYFVRCKSEDEFGQSSRWQTETEGITVTVSDDVGIPQNIQTIPSWNSINLSWEKPYSGMENEDYEIRYHKTGESWSYITTDNLYWLHSGLETGDIVTYQLRVVTDFETGEWSEEIVSEAGHTPPVWEDNSLRSLDTYSPDVVTLSWSSPTFYDGATLDHYEVWQSEDGSSYYYVKTVSSTSTTINPENESEYSWKILSVDNQTGSSYSNSVSTTIDLTPPTTVTIDSIPDVTNDFDIQLSWSSSSDSMSGFSHYEFQYSDDSLFTSSNTILTDKTSKIVTISGNEFTWFFRVRPVDNVDNKGSWSSSESTTLISEAGEEYSKITSIWFNKKDLLSNSPVKVTLFPDERYKITSAKFTASNQNFILNPDGNGFSTVWNPSDNIDELSFKIVNEKSSATTLTVPIEVFSKNTSNTDTVYLVKEDSVIPVIYSSKFLDVSAYQDEYGCFHVSFGEQPNGTVTIDLTGLEPVKKEGKIWIFNVDWLDKEVIECKVHGIKESVRYKIKKQGETIIEGFNDFITKILDILFGKDFKLVSDEEDYTIISGLEKYVSVEYK